MPKFLIERNIAGAGKLTRDQLVAMAQASCNAIRTLGPEIQWIQSYVLDDKIYCVYIAADEGMIREHAHRGGFPVDSVRVIRQIVDPTTADAA